MVPVQVVSTVPSSQVLSGTTQGLQGLQGEQNVQTSTFLGSCWKIFRELNDD